MIRNRPLRLAGLAAAVLVSGCTTLGTNVSGSFTCQSPDGICAPSTTIDDGALAEIQQVSSTELLSPAGPYRLDDGERPVPDMVVATAEGFGTYRLNVVFPAFVDARGQHHGRASVTTDVRLPGRGDALDALALRGAGASRNRGLLAAAESAPPVLAIAVPAVSGPATRDADTEAAGAQLAAGPSPVDRIREDVETTLAGGRPLRQAASFPGSPE